MSDVVMIIAPKMFRDEEYAEPKRVLEARGARVVTASLARGKCIGKLGMIAEAEVSLSEAADRQWDAVVFIGGGGSEVFFDEPIAHGLARETLDRGAVVGAICIAPSTLAHADLLHGVKATAFPSQRSDLIHHGARWDAGPVVVDGRIVTANGPDAAQRFGHEIADLLGL
jgi:protease I